MLLKAFAESKYTGDLVIAGSGAELERLKLQAKDLGIVDRVEFAGFLPDDEIYSLMQHADAFVLTSEQEGFGITVLESMALRTPVISTSCGGPEDVVVDGVTGFLAEVGDTAQIARLISKVTSGDVRKIVEAAYRVAEQQKPAKVVERILEIHLAQQQK